MTGDIDETPSVPSVSPKKRVKTGGRQKGAKNKSTLLKEALRGDFDVMLQDKAKAIFNVVADQALEGCRASQKMILDRVVPTVHAESDKKDANKFDGGITINIGSLEDARSVKVEPDIEDAEYEEL
jgi:hypothetical protein